MKKMLFAVLLSVPFLSYAEQDEASCGSIALSAGYVFKHDCTFKQVYGRGIANLITVDGCYYPWECWGIGAQVSYWRKRGRTTFLKQRTHLREIPVILSIRRKKDFDCGLRLYGSLGGGIVWGKEKSYLGCVKVHKGIAAVEAGLEYPIWCDLSITGAVRYLFPRQSQAGHKVTIGGADLRAGLSWAF